MSKVVQATFPYLAAIIAAGLFSAGIAACGSSTTSGAGGSSTTASSSSSGGGGGSTTGNGGGSTTGNGGGTTTGAGGNAPTCGDGIKNGAETDTDCGGPTCEKCALGKACDGDGDCAAGSCIGGVCETPAPSCGDGMKNGTETDTDCGGDACPTCADGKTCGASADCQNGVCNAGVCASPTCDDGMKNGAETDTDCGGPTCGKCANGQTCGDAADCSSGNCASNVCAAPAPTCNDGMKNGNESDVDCGGPTCNKCENGKACGNAADCSSAICTNNVCSAPAGACNDGMKNGNESDVDCGGPACNKCANGKACGSLVDCTSASCAGGVCAAIGPTCTDAMKNAAETDVDCGGNACGKCANGKACLANTDCLSAGCVGNVCAAVAATCNDGLKNGAESDVDCGGNACPKCAVGKTCTGAGDCVIIGGFAQCQNGICIVPNAPCGDSVKNGTESDIDCGGASCVKCNNGWICGAGSDCKSGNCAGNICVVAGPSCVDGAKNAGETDTDCGGPVCAKCASGQGCANNGDCLSNSCVGNVCALPAAAQVLWSKRFGNATDQECDVVKTDASENIFLANYITGKVDYGLGTVGLGEYISLVKLNPAGNTLWSKAYPDGTKQYPNGLAINATGNLFLSGGYYFKLKFGAPAATLTAIGSDDFYAAGFTNVGATLWAKSFGSATEFQQFNQGAVDLKGNPVMTGWINGSANFGGGALNGNNVDVVVVKLDKNGGHLWSHAYGNGNLQGGHGVVVDGNGNVIVVGYLNGSVNFGGGAVGPAGSSIFILKLDQNGNHVWSKTFGSTQNELKTHRVAVDAAGNVFIGGGKRGSVNFGGGALPTNAGAGIYDAFIAKFDSSGNHVWSKSFGDGNEQWVSDLVADKDGNVIAVGSFLGSINFGGGAMNSLGGTEFGGDVFITKLSGANGSQLFAARYGDAAQQEPKSVTLDPSGNVVVCGLFRGSINFGGGALATAGANDIFVTKMSLP